MTIEAAEGGDPEPGPGTCGRLAAHMDRLAADYAALMADLAADRDRPDLARRVSALTVALRETSNRMAGHVFADAYGTAKAATAPAAAPAATGRHRTRTAPLAKVYHLRPRPAHGLAPAAVLLAGHGTRHVLAAHFKLGVTAAAAASVAAAGVTYTMQTTPDRQSLAPAVTAPAVVPSAVALPAPDPDSGHPGTLRKHARRAAARVVTFPPATRPPAAATLPPAPAPGVLTIQQPSVTLQQTTPGQYTGQLTLYAGGGPVRWRIDWLNTSSALQISQPFGVIPDGQPATITVTVDAGAAQSGPWTIAFEDGQQVTVTAAG